MKNLLLVLFLCPVFLFAQITGTIIEQETNNSVFGAKIISSNGQKTMSNLNGAFSIKASSFPLTLIFSAQMMENDTVVVTGPVDLKVILRRPFQNIKTVVVTSGRRNQNIEDVPISMEILKPKLIDNKGFSNLEEAVDQSPGVYTMDGQVSIRGGSGFAYGAGSRVMLLWNGMPILSADAGDAKWNAIPMEATSQIEILKGASSVLYGSGALNGIISLNERLPSLKGETRIKVQSGIYGNPQRETLKWWTTPRVFHQTDAYYGKMYKNVGFTISANGYTNPGYKQGEEESRARISGTFYVRPQKYDRIKAGIGYNFQYQKSGNFIIWESDTFAYTPSGGADTSFAESTLTYNSGSRLSVDPYIKWHDKKGNKHSLKSRLYSVINTNITNPSQSSNAYVLYGDYQLQRKWGENNVVTSGFTGIRNLVQSNLFGDHYSSNLGLYSQYERSFNKLDLTGGIRFEYFEQDGKQGDSQFYFGNDASAASMPIYPILRAGAHYEIKKYTHLRASFGQGIRYPSVAERYTTTNVGALNVFASPNLTREKGWAAEIGLKQGVRIGSKWKGMIDIAAFVNQYNDMMEFTFGIFNPGNSERLDPTSPNYNQQIIDILFSGYSIEQMFGFSAENAESARIIGTEFSFNSQGEIGDVELTSLIGYTYMLPKTLNSDSAYVSTFSTYEYDETTQTSSYDQTLKYRFNHLIKADIEAAWKGASLGMSVRYNSYMKNIDDVFETELSPGLFILPGLREYRELNNKGIAVLDARLGYTFKENYRLGFIVNNVLNVEYISRPGDVQAPRSFILQLQLKF